MASLSVASSVGSSAGVLWSAHSPSSSSFSSCSKVRMAPVKQRLAVVAMTTSPNKEDVIHDKDMIPTAIAEALKMCEENPTSPLCAVAWDEVEELTAEAAHQRDRQKTTSDPLEAYCADNPETDECRTYDD